MNCGLRVKASGETDFPCMSGTRVGQGRSYVRLGQGEPDRLRAVVRRHRARPKLRERRLCARARLHGQRPAGRATSWRSPPGQGHGQDGRRVLTRDAARSPRMAALIPVGGRRYVGDTVIKRETQTPDPIYQRGQRLVEVIVNGRAVASREVPADGRQHALEFPWPSSAAAGSRSGSFPSCTRTPSRVIVAGKPIRAVARERAVGARVHRSALARARAADRDRRARGGGEGVRRGEGVLRRVAAEAPADK